MDKTLIEKGVYAFGRFRLDPVRRTLTRDGLAVAITPRLFDTLLFLVENPGRVVEKDEIMNAVWPGRFVEERNISQTIFTLRKTLSGAGEDDRFIDTAPGRGYRFAVPVRLDKAGPEPGTDTPGVFSDAPPNGGAVGIGAARQEFSNSIQAGVDGGRRFFWRIATGVGAALLAIGLIVFTADRRGSPISAQPQTVVLADFQNLTRDSAFDTVLGKVLEIDLAQSPFLTLVSQQQVSETLQLMERPKGTPLTLVLAQEVCARNHGNAVLGSTIAALGRSYIVTLEAIDCVSGKRVAQDKAETDRKEDVPQLLDRLTVQMRESLNESPGSISKFDVPIERATTSSFEALTAFSLGERERAKGDNASSLPLLRRAIELDPSFALSYEELGAAYLGLREGQLGQANYQKAFDLRDRTSEIEKLRISANYYQLFGNFNETARSYQAWAQIYPRDWRPCVYLANLYTRMAQYGNAIAAGRQAMTLNPEHGLTYIVLARAYKRAGLFDDAKAIGRKAEAKALDGWDIHGLMYEIAFAQGDRATMARQVAKESGKPTENWMLDYEAGAAATSGKRKLSSALLEKAIEVSQNQGPDARDLVTGFSGEYVEMLAVFGLQQEARKIALGTPNIEESEDALLPLARAGEFDRAATLGATLGERHPASSFINAILRPSIQAVIDLGKGRPDDAILALKPALPFELQDFEVPSLLGQAYLDKKAPGLAAAEYRKILANRGVDGLSPFYPLAYLGLARALDMQGKFGESRAAYEQLFAFWKDADGDLPVLQDARREFAKRRFVQE